jgi:hypothetical protein
MDYLQTVRQQQIEMTNVAPPTFSEALVASQKTILWVKYTPQLWLVMVDQKATNITKPT